MAKKHRKGIEQKVNRNKTNLINTGKKKGTAHRSKPFLTVIYWILGLLIILLMYLKIRHMFISHYK
jgi:hypothetical protein